MPNLTPKTQRTITRYIHVLIGLALGTYVYLPLRYDSARDTLRLVLMFAGIPLIVATGLWLWKGAALRRTIRPTSTTTGRANQ